MEPTSDQSVAQLMAEGIRRCPFLRNINEPTMARVAAFAGHLTKAPGVPGPLFEEDLGGFETAFRLFHGSNGIVPLARLEDSSPVVSRCPPAMVAAREPSTLRPAAHTSVRGSASAPELHPVHTKLAASAATISFSAFGANGPFSFHAFKAALDAGAAKKSREREGSQRKAEAGSDKGKQSAHSLDEVAVPHVAEGAEWLQSGKCPLAKSYRAFNRIVPIVAGMVKPPKGMKYECPAAIVAARAALAKTPAMRRLRPQGLPVKVLAIGALGCGFNVPCGAWREHCRKFSPEWIVAVHLSVPFIAMLRKAALMPKYAMIFTIAASIVGQTLGSRLERARLARKREALGLPSLEVARGRRRRKGPPRLAGGGRWKRGPQVAAGPAEVPGGGAEGVRSCAGSARGEWSLTAPQHVGLMAVAR